jgi:glyoxylase-like metal-dependent hydrolase (beta-lactamase superfamily II)
MISDAMLSIPAGNPSPWTGPEGNNTYLLTGAVPTLIDAGVGEPAHIEAVGNALGGSALAQILITHSHPDHARGVPALVSRWPGALVRNLAPDYCVDNESIPAGDTTLRALQTPGHAPDHFCFLDEATRDVYCGDLARLGGTIVVPATAGGSLVQYLDSLRRIRALPPRRLLPGHGPVIDDPVTLIDRYLEHRAEREAQVLDALRSGASSVEALVQRIYTNLHPTVVRAAADSMLAHLIKLRDEGRVIERDGEWREVGR